MKPLTERNLFPTISSRNLYAILRSVDRGVPNPRLGLRIATAGSASHPFPRPSPSPAPRVPPRARVGAPCLPPPLFPLLFRLLSRSARSLLLPGLPVADPVFPSILRGACLAPKNKKEKQQRAHAPHCMSGGGDATADTVTSDHYSSTAQSNTPRPISSCHARSRRAIKQQSHEADEATAGHSPYLAPSFTQYTPHSATPYFSLRSMNARANERGTSLRENSHETRRSRKRTTSNVLLSLSVRRYLLAVRVSLHRVFLFSLRSPDARALLYGGFSAPPTQVRAHFFVLSVYNMFRYARDRFKTTDVTRDRGRGRENDGAYSPALCVDVRARGALEPDTLSTSGTYTRCNTIGHHTLRDGERR